MGRSLLGSAIALLVLAGPLALAARQKPAAKGASSTKPAAGAANPTSGAGTVEGTFTVNGKSVALKHVYALIKPDAFHPEKDALYVYLTDVPVTEDKLRDEFGLSEDARSGKVHAIEIKFNDEAQPMGGQVYNNNFKDTASMSVSGMHKFVPRQFEPGKIIAGKLYVEPDSFFSDRWGYTATFSAPVLAGPVRKPASEAPLDSPPAEAARAFLAALQTKNKEAVKKTVMPDMAKELDGEQGDGMLQMMAEMLSTKLKVTSVLMEGEDKAYVTLQNKEEHETVRLGAAKINGQWKIAKNN